MYDYIDTECSECPHGLYCQGAQLPPVQRTGFWSNTEVYPDAVTVIAVRCDYRNVRGVCVGYPEVQNQTLLQFCLYHPQDGWCGRNVSMHVRVHARVSVCACVCACERELAEQAKSSREHADTFSSYESLSLRPLKCSAYSARPHAHMSMRVCMFNCVHV